MTGKPRLGARPTPRSAPGCMRGTARTRVRRGAQQGSAGGAADGARREATSCTRRSREVRARISASAPRAFACRASHVHDRTVQYSAGGDTSCAPSRCPGRRYRRAAPPLARESARADSLALGTASRAGPRPSRARWLSARWLRARCACGVRGAPPHRGRVLVRYYLSQFLRTLCGQVNGLAKRTAIYRIARGARTLCSVLTTPLPPPPLKNTSLATTQ